MVIQRLTNVHDRSRFDCERERLNTFLRNSARKETDIDLGVTWVAVPASTDPAVIGYYTLTVGQVSGDIVPEGKVKTRMVVPIIELGRLGVDKDHKGQHIGTKLLLHAFYRACQADIGAYAFVLTANDQDAKDWYLHFEEFQFKELLDDPMHLYTKMSTLRALNLGPPPEQTDTVEQDE